MFKKFVRDILALKPVSFVFVPIVSIRSLLGVLSGIGINN
jgi:hypothetical protein